MKLLVALVAAAPLVACAGQGKQTDQKLCQLFKQELNSKTSLHRFMLLSSQTKGGEEQYLNVDVDGDDVSDEIKGGCPASLQTADSCTLSIKLSSGLKQLFQFEHGERFYLVRYRGGIYAIVNDHGTDRQESPRSVVSLDKRGIQRVCTNL
jgi:hypothetical protein